MAYHEYPKMLYAAGCETHRMCDDAKAEDSARAVGFGNYHEMIDAATKTEHAGQPQVIPPIPEDAMRDVTKLMAYARSIGMKVGPKNKLENLLEKVNAFVASKG